MTNKSIPSETESPKPKKKMALPKSISKTFYEKYSPIISKAQKELGHELGGYAGLLKAKKENPKLFNRILEITNKEIKERKENKKKMSVGGLSTKKYVNPVTIVDNRKNK